MLYAEPALPYARPGVARPAPEMIAPRALSPSELGAHAVFDALLLLGAAEA